MSYGNPFENQISNRNFLSPTGFKFILKRAPKVSFFGNSANLPAISMGTAIQPTYLKDIDRPGDKVQFEDFNFRFLVDENLETKNVNIFVRPEAVKLSQEQTPVNGVKGTVMASKLMGSYSFVHLSVLNDDNEIIHVHSHMPPNFLPNQSSAVGIEIDSQQTFIFPSN